MSPTVPAAAIAGAFLSIVGASSGPSDTGWLALAAGALSAFALWRAGSVRAWKETAEARDERIGDLERELAELRAELAIPERIEGIVRLMGETAVHQDAAAERRLELAMGRLDARWDAHESAAEARAARLLAAVRREAA